MKHENNDNKTSFDQKQSYRSTSLVSLNQIACFPFPSDPNEELDINTKEKNKDQKIINSLEKEFPKSNKNTNFRINIVPINTIINYIKMNLSDNNDIDDNKNKSEIKARKSNNFINSKKKTNFKKSESHISISSSSSEDIMELIDINEDNSEDNINIQKKENNVIKKSKKRAEIKKLIKIDENASSFSYKVSVGFSKLLCTPYKIINKNKIIQAFIYSINIEGNTNNNKYGFIFPTDIFKDKVIKVNILIKNQNICVNIKREKMKFFKFDEILSIIQFHTLIFYSLIEKAKIIFNDNLKGNIKKLLCENNDYKKYYFVPLLSSEQILNIDNKKINDCLKSLNLINKHIKSSDEYKIREIFINMKKINLFKLYEIAETNIIENDKTQKSQLDIFTKEDKNIFQYIPLIFLNFEQKIKIYEFMYDFPIFKDITDGIKNYNYEKIDFLEGALTLSKFKSNDFKNLTYILGVSILNLIVKIGLISLENTSENITNINKIEIIITGEQNLYNVGFQFELFDYIINELDKDKILQFAFKKSISYDIIGINNNLFSNIIKSIIGAIFIITNDINKCAIFCKTIQLFNLKNYIVPLNLTGVIKNYKTLYNKQKNDIYKDIEQKFNNLHNFDFSHIIDNIINNISFCFNTNIIEISKNYYDKNDREKAIFKGDINDLIFFEKCKLFYEFENKELLKSSLYIKSNKGNNDENYQNMKNLGITIIEFFVSDFILKLSNEGNKNIKIIVDDGIEMLMHTSEFKNTNINDIKLIKKYLFSDLVILRIFLMLELENYIDFNNNDIILSNKIKVIKDSNNKFEILNSPLNELLKINFELNAIKDVIFCLIGSISVDSNLKKVWDFLYILLSPLIIYYCIFVKSLYNNNDNEKFIFLSNIGDFESDCQSEINTKLIGRKKK